MNKRNPKKLGRKGRESKNLKKKKSKLRVRIDETRRKGRGPEGTCGHRLPKRFASFLGNAKQGRRPAERRHDGHSAMRIATMGILEKTNIKEGEKNVTITSS